MTGSSFGTLATYLLNRDPGLGSDPYDKIGPMPQRPAAFNPGPRITAGELALLLAGVVGPQIAQRHMPETRRDPAQAWAESFGAARDVLGLSRERRQLETHGQEEDFNARVNDWLARARVAGDQADQMRARAGETRATAEEARRTALFGPDLRAAQAGASEAETKALFAKPTAEANIAASKALTAGRAATTGLSSLRAETEKAKADWYRIRNSTPPKGGLTVKDLNARLNAVRDARRRTREVAERTAQAATGTYPDYLDHATALANARAEVQDDIAELDTEESNLIDQINGLTGRGGGGSVGGPAPAPDVALGKASLADAARMPANPGVSAIAAATGGAAQGGDDDFMRWATGYLDSHSLGARADTTRAKRRGAGGSY